MSEATDTETTDVAERDPSAMPVDAVLTWAATRQSPVTISLERDGCWQNHRSQMLGFDSAEKLIKVDVSMASPESTEAPGTPASAALAVTAGQLVGITFRRGHKKCVFVTRVVMLRQENNAQGSPIQTLILRAPTDLREMQRRSYQRITIPAERFIAVRLWQGGLPSAERSAWPLCSGRVGNVSMGGLLVDIRREHNPRLSVGETVGVEITPRPGGTPLLVDAQYRHCVIAGSERLGLGVQFLGLERDMPGRATMAQVNSFINDVRRYASRANWSA